MRYVDYTNGCPPRTYEGLRAWSEKWGKVFPEQYDAHVKAQKQFAQDERNRAWAEYEHGGSLPNDGWDL